MTIKKHMETEPLKVRDLLRFRLESIAPVDAFVFVLCSLVALGLSLLVPVMIRALTGEVLERGSLLLLMGVGVVLLSSALFEELIKIPKSLAGLRLRRKTKNALEETLMRRVLNLPIDVAKRYPVGELKKRMEDAAELSDVGMDTAIALSTGIFTAAAFFIQMLHFEVHLVAPAFLILGVTIVLTVINARALTGQKAKIQRSEADLSGVELEMLSALTKLKQTGAGERAYHRWEEKFLKNVKDTYAPPVFLRVMPVCITAVKLLGTLLLYAAAASWGTKTADYLAFLAAYGGMTAALLSLTELSGKIAEIPSLYEMASPILDVALPKEAERPPVEPLKGDISIRDLSFSYVPGIPVIRGLNLDISAGECIGIAGATGCGKTTLVRLLLGLLTPSEGSIAYDGADMKNLDKTTLRRQMGTVMQDGFLMADDIRSNVALTRPEASDEEIWEALDAVGMKDYIEELPPGLDTQIYENAGGFSGGEKARLMIARALLNKPRILLLDEATGPLDVRTERRVMDAVKGYGGTKIIVAHRLSALKNCDRICYMEKGCIKECGTFEELVQNDRKFARMVKGQF